MKMTITGRKVTVRPSFVERTEKKLSKLDKFFEDSVTADVTVSKENANKQRVEITIRTGGLVFRAEEACEDANEAVDRLVDVLLRQIRKNDSLWDGPVEEEAEFHVVRSKSFPVKPLDVEEAILQMNTSGHQFYMFRNMDSGEINVVYRRHNGDYGLLEPHAEE